ARSARDGVAGCRAARLKSQLASGWSHPAARASDFGMLRTNQSGSGNARAVIYRGAFEIANIVAIELGHPSRLELTGGERRSSEGGARESPRRQAAETQRNSR